MKQRKQTMKIPCHKTKETNNEDSLTLNRHAMKGLIRNVQVLINKNIRLSRIKNTGLLCVLQSHRGSVKT